MASREVPMDTAAWSSLEGTEGAMRSLEGQLEKVDRELDTVAKKIENVDEAIEATVEEAKHGTDATNLQYLRETERALRQKESDLRQKESDLRKKESDLRSDLRQERISLRQQLSQNEQQLAKKRRMDAPSYKLPSLGTQSPSSLARTPSQRLTQLKPLDTHWFALEVYNTYLQAQDLQKKQTDYTLKVAGTPFDIQKLRVQAASKAINVAFEKCVNPQEDIGRGMQTTADLMTAEVTVSSLVARALDRLIFTDESVSTGACFHHGPTRKRPNTTGNPECADVLITKVSSNYPSTPVLVSDIQKQDLSHAGKETTCYSMNVAAVTHNTTGTPTFPVVVALPTTPALSTLEIHVSVHNGMWRIPVVTSNLKEEALLSTLCATVRYLCTTEPLTHSPPLQYACPFKEGTYTVLGHSTSSQLHNSRVFLKDNTVYKFFWKDDGYEHNLPLLTSIGALKNVEVNQLTADNRVVVLSYTYIPGTHKPHKLKQFANVVRLVSLLHDKGYVHGDIRCANLIFPNVEEGGVLIDFDLARKEGTTYPENYNSRLDERHQDAKPHHPMRREHDRYSLSIIVKLFFPSYHLLDKKFKLKEVFDDLS